ncbi:MAG: hypothetical protein SW833_24090 [Cyanobacteriota bacterium]|nr:hypothetical protein [Cyanobacteriota bacterium]
MTEPTTHVREDLSTIWDEVWQKNFEGELWKSDPDKRKEIKQRLDYFDSNHSEQLSRRAQLFVK